MDENINTIYYYLLLGTCRQRDATDVAKTVLYIIEIRPSLASSPSYFFFNHSGLIIFPWISLFRCESPFILILAAFSIQATRDLRFAIGGILRCESRMYIDGISLHLCKKYYAYKTPRENHRTVTKAISKKSKCLQNP